MERGSKSAKKEPHAHSSPDNSGRGASRFRLNSQSQFTGDIFLTSKPVVDERPITQEDLLDALKMYPSITVEKLTKWREAGCVKFADGFWGWIKE